MRRIFTIAIIVSIILSACSKWNVVRQNEIDFNVNATGFNDENHGITVGYAGEVHYTADGGKDWNSGDNKSYCRFGLEIIDSNIAYHCGNAGHVGFSKDGGKTWRRTTSFGEMQPRQCRYMSFADRKTGWIAAPERLASTSDEGYTWNEIALPKEAGSIKAISVWSAHEGCILDNNYTLYFTSDGGETWQNQTMHIESEGINKKIPLVPNTAMRFFDKDTGTIIAIATTAEATKLLEISTADGGKTWTEEEIPVSVFEESTIFLSRDGNTLTLFDTAEGIRVLKRAGI